MLGDERQRRGTEDGAPSELKNECRDQTALRYHINIVSIGTNI